MIKKTTNQARLVITLDREFEERLEALGATNDSSKISMARERLLDALEEELQDLRLAERRSKDPARCWTQEELERGVDLDNRGERETIP